MIHLVNNFISLSFSETSGSLYSIRKVNKQVNMLSEDSSELPLFTIRWRKDKSNDTKHLTAKDASNLLISSKEDGKSNAIYFRYEFNDQPISEVLVTVSVPTENSSAIFDFETIVNSDEGYIEWISYPGIYVPNNLIKSGGDGRILWPALEGVLIEDMDQREKSWMSYKPIEYPNRGWAGYYPGCAPMQFLAYYTEEGNGLYFSSEDTHFHTKEVEYCQSSAESIQLLIKTYPGAIRKQNYRLPFSMKIELFEGDWQDAAEIYRTWSERFLPLPNKISENEKIPNWIKSSPIVATYPITGEGHHSGPTQPNEFFPYEKAIPHLDRLANALDSHLLTLLMQWEGTAPWAPPYVWPPLGGEKMLKNFADELHDKGHYLGLYCSGLAWTTTADTGPGNYNRKEEEKEENRIKEMCQGPEGEYECLICNGEGIRLGYDMCVASEFAQEVTIKEAINIANADVDYIQLLDQNLGGAAYQCYDESHGHPGAPGPWQAKEMNKLLSKVQNAFNKEGKEVILGCEAASAESYLENLPVNDLRFQIGYNMGKPVPLYNYVYHQYVVNFMGNQVEALEFLDKEKSPENHYLRYAYSFIAGDLLTVVLADKGEIHWSWCTKWDIEKPEQEPMIRFIEHLNTCRKTIARDFLVTGKMLKPWNIISQEYTLHLANDKSIEYPSVLSSRWESEAGEVAQLLVNYLPKEQNITINEAGSFNAQIHNGSSQTLSQGEPLSIPALTTVLIKKV